MGKLVFGLLSSASASPGQARLREFTIAWSRYGYHGPIIEATGINQLLDQACAAGYQHCLIQQTGHIIDEQWTPPHWGKEAFHTALRRWIGEQDFFITGDWQQSDTGCYGLKTDGLLVDLNQYQLLGKPDFGQPSEQYQTLLQAKLVTQQNSELTSRLTAGTGQQQLKPDIAGWGFIDASLRQNTPVLGFPAAVNHDRLNLNVATGDAGQRFFDYLDKPLNGFADDPLLSADQQRFLQGIGAQTQHARNGVFLWNIESYQDLQATDTTTPLDAVCTVAAGFKTNRILQVHGYAPTTRVIFFDYSQQALKIRRQMVTEWDGTDYPGYIRHLFHTNPHPETFYQLWQDVTPDNVNWSDMEYFWQLELDKWGGAQAFRQHWLAYQQLPHTFIACNLLSDPQPLLAAIKSLNSVYVWWSNAFFTVNSNWFYSNAERKRNYQRWITALAHNNPQALINGADYNNVAVNGITADDYLQQFQTQPCNELNPKQRHQIGIHF